MAPSASQPCAGTHAHPEYIVGDSVGMQCWDSSAGWDKCSELSDFVSEGDLVAMCGMQWGKHHSSMQC
jgi:hypothetical protein